MKNKAHLLDQLKQCSLGMWISTTKDDHQEHESFNNYLNKYKRKQKLKLGIIKA